MLRTPHRKPSQPLAAAVVSPLAPALAGTAVVSGVVNILALTSPLFMLQVYDRVLASRSLSTLVGLAALAAVLFAFQSMLDVMRSRVLLRIGETFDRRLSGRVHEAIVRLPLEARMPGDGLQPLRDLDNVRGFLAGQAAHRTVRSSSGSAALSRYQLPVSFLDWDHRACGSIILVSHSRSSPRCPVEWRRARGDREFGMARNALAVEARRRNAESGSRHGAWRPAWRQCAGTMSNDGLSGSHESAQRRCRRRPRGVSKISADDPAIGASSAVGAVSRHSAGSERRSHHREFDPDVPRIAPVELAIASWKPFLSRAAELGPARLDQLRADSFAAREQELFESRSRNSRRVSDRASCLPRREEPTLTGLEFCSARREVRLASSARAAVENPHLRARWSASGRRRAARSASMARVSNNGTGKSLVATSAICRRVSNCSTAPSPRTSPGLRCRCRRHRRRGPRGGRARSHSSL